MTADDTGPWTDASVEQATSGAAASLLVSISKALADAPSGKRFDVEVVVEEHDQDG